MKNKRKTIVIVILCAILAGALFFAIRNNSTAAPTTQEIVTETGTDYAKEENWVYFGIGEDKDVDLFLICPTVDMNDEYNMSLNDEKSKYRFVGALNMERGLYEENTRMYAPYYRQIAMSVYALDPEDREQYLEIAYADVSAAFRYYLENENNGRPIVIAGFSQGADMCYRLMEEYFGDKDLYNQLVAVYAIGWPCTEEMVNKYPQIKPAQSSDDIGVVINFDCEAEDVTGTLIIPENTKALSINPLNWKTDSTPAGKELNQGACFTNYNGKIESEIKELCGCYIDPERGALKVPDVNPINYPALIPGIPEGGYHIYDYQFFFRNLQENVRVRIEAYQETKAQ